MSKLETISPSADLRNHFSEISRKCREDGKAVIITGNGRGDTLSPGCQNYELMKAELELLEMLEDAEEDVKTGRTAPLKDSFDTVCSNLYKVGTSLFNVSPLADMKYQLLGLV